MKGREKRTEEMKEAEKVSERRDQEEIQEEVETWGQRHILQEYIQDLTFWKRKYTLNIHLKLEAKNQSSYQQPTFSYVQQNKVI